MFRDWNGIEAIDASSANPQDVQAFKQASQGPPISHGTVLAKDPNAPAVYLIDNGRKRHIASPAVMDQFYFSWNAIQSMSGDALAALPNGDTINGTVSGLLDQVQALKSGVLIWNQWRLENPGININLGGANLGGANLSGANLRRADLSHANLSGADLRANLWYADLSGANLSGAALGDAWLGGANLSGANLGGADLQGASLQGANLSGAFLIHTDVTREQLNTAASLQGATLPQL